MRVLLAKAALSAARRYLEKRHQNTRRSRVTAPVDLEPPEGLGPCRPRAPRRVRVRVPVRDRVELGLGWSGPTCKLEIDDMRPAESFVQDAPAHSGSRHRHTSTQKRHIYDQ